MNVKTPSETASAAMNAGLAKGRLTTRGSIGRLIVLAVTAGVYIGLGGVLSIIVGQGMPGIGAANPALPRLAGAMMFPIGLILIVVLGGELFTGNNALLMPPLLSGRISARRVCLNWLIVWCGNFAGALGFAALMVYGVGLISTEPWHTGVVTLATAKCSMPWIVVFVKGIGANWCVCLAVWLALSGHTLLEKMAGCFLPVMAFVALGYEHCVANMFFVPLGIMEGADIEIWSFVAGNLLPSTLGNIVGGAVFVGTLFARLHLTDSDK